MGGVPAGRAIQEGELSGAVRFADGTVWPRIDIEGEHEASLEWRLRYGDPTRSDCLAAASVIGAYRSLVLKPQRRRNEVCTALRKAEGLR